MYKQQFKPLIVTRNKQDLYFGYVANLEHKNIGKGNMEDSDDNRCINQVICIGPAFDTSVLG